MVRVLPPAPLGSPLRPPPGGPAYSRAVRGARHLHGPGHLAPGSPGGPVRYEARGGTLGLGSPIKPRTGYPSPPGGEGTPVDHTGRHRPSGLGSLCGPQPQHPGILPGHTGKVKRFIVVFNGPPSVVRCPQAQTAHPTLVVYQVEQDWSSSFCRYFVGIF